MAIPFIKTSFVAGEVAPSFFGHVDNQHYALGLSTCRNAFVSVRGGAYSRAGTAFVGYSKQVGNANPPRLIRFQFNIKQGLVLEFGDLYMRVIQNGAFVTDAPIAITGITRASPAIVSASNSYTNGDWGYISGVAGMNAVNNQVYVIGGTVTGSSFGLFNVFGAPINSSGFNAYTSGGTIARIYTLVTPWRDFDLKWLKLTQSANTMSICCWNQDTGALYPSYDLVRIANNDWSIAEASFSSTIAAPGQPSLALTHPAGALGSNDTSESTYGFEVTAVNPADGTESVASAPASVSGTANLAVTSGAILLNWSPSDGAEQYNIYACQSIDGTTASPPANFIPAGVLYGYAGTSHGTAFTFGNTIPDFAQVPPTHRNPFAPAQIISAPVTAAGAYTVAPTTIAITTSTGSGAVLEPVYDPQSGTVTSVLIIDPGTGYDSADTWDATDGTFTTAASGTITPGPATGTYPSVVSYFQERRVYAATPNQPDTYFMSQPGAFLNFDRRIPTIDSDAITGTPWSEKVDGIQFMVSMPGGLIVLTGDSAWQLTGVGGSSLNPQPITPSNQQAQPQAYNGCHPHIPPFKLNWEVFYVQAKGSIIRAWSYNFFVNIYTGLDLTYLSSHLFQPSGMVNADGIVREWAWCEEPYRLLWVAREDGTFLSLTYFKEQEVAGWARHDTDGRVGTLCSIPELPIDALYMGVLRDSLGAWTIERMDNRLWQDVENSWCVDCGLTLPLYAPATTLIPAAASGNGVPFFTTAAFFNSDYVGQVIRVGGGVATIAAYISSTEVLANITTPIAIKGPNGVPLRQGPGNWTVSPVITRVTGLNHLLGRQVTGVADGVQLPLMTVVTFSDGTVGIDLPHPASMVTVGLPFQAQVQSLYLDAGQPTIQGRRKKVASVVVRLEASLGIKVGSNQPDGSTLSPPQIAPAWANLSAVPDRGPSDPTAGGAMVQQLWTGDSQKIPITGGFAVPGQVCVQQDNPLPMQVLAFIPDVLPGDLPEAEAAPAQRHEMRRGA